MSGTTVDSRLAEVAWRRRLDSLTGLRWIAAFAVFGFHLRLAGLTDDPLLDDALDVLFSSGSSGVPFFFILSGMVLTWSARPGGSATTFWRHRVARVAPNHVVTWLAVAAMMTIAGVGVAIEPAVVGLLLLQSWVPDASYYFAVNTPAWSLSCELAFYAVFPVLLPLMRRVPPSRLAHLVVGLVAAIWLVPLLSLSMSDSLAYWFVWIFPGTRLLEFALGIAVGLLVASGGWRGPSLRTSAALSLVAYLCVPLAPERWGWVAWTAGPFALLIGAAASADGRENRRSFLRSRPMVWLGTVSFAFYLVHQPVIGVVGRLVGEDAPVPVAVAAMVASLAASIVAAAVLHRVVEVPAERRLR